MPFGHPRFGQLLPCVCTLAKQAVKAQARQAEHIAAMRSDMGELADKTFESFNPKWDTEFTLVLHSALTRTRAYATDPGSRWLFLSGPTGTGKSHLAAACVNRLAHRYRAYYRSVPAMLNELRRGYSAGDFDSRLQAICDIDVLVLDDLGAEPRTESNRGLLFEIVNHRAMRDSCLTIITSNCDLEPGETYDPQFPPLESRIASRIQMRAMAVDVISRDYRAVVLGKQAAI